MGIGEKLKDLREEFGYSVKELSIFIGISEKSLTIYENGERIPRDEVKIAFGNFFGWDRVNFFY